MGPPIVWLASETRRPGVHDERIVAVQFERWLRDRNGRSSSIALTREVTLERPGAFLEAALSMFQAAGEEWTMAEMGAIGLKVSQKRHDRRAPLGVERVADEAGFDHCWCMGSTWPLSAPP